MRTRKRKEPRASHRCQNDTSFRAESGVTWSREPRVLSTHNSNILDYIAHHQNAKKQNKKRASIKTEARMANVSAIFAMPIQIQVKSNLFYSLSPRHSCSGRALGLCITTVELTARGLSAARNSCGNERLSTAVLKCS